MKAGFFPLSLIWIFLSGCQNIKPGVYPEHSEMKKGPGLFTGERGEYDVLSSHKALSQKDLDKSGITNESVAKN